jgi:hypothetical protein
MGITKFMRDVVGRKILVPHIDNYFNMGKFPDSFNFSINMNKEPDDDFHPSGDCYPCIGELYRKRMGHHQPHPLTAASQKNFAVGHFWHGLLQTILVEELGFATKDDVEMLLKYKKDNWAARGSCDIARCYLPTQKDPLLVDFKTMNARYFAMDPLPKDLLDKWTLQVNCYMDWLGDVKRAIIVGIKKDSPHEFREIIIDYNPDLLVPVYSKWTEVIDAIQQQRIPKCLQHGAACQYV